MILILIRNLKKSIFILAASFSCIVLSILGLVPLFKSLLALLAVFLISGILSLPELKRSLNMNLLVIAVFALAVGKAVEITGLGALFSDTVVRLFEPLGTVGILAAVYIVTNLLADFITTAAAASIVFPFAASAAVSLGIDGTPFFLAVAYGAAANFITPIGYQTNLMIYGPGGYRFKDFMTEAVNQNSGSHAVVMQEGGELIDHPLKDMSQEVWTGFQEKFLLGEG